MIDEELRQKIERRAAILAAIKMDLIERLQLEYGPDDLDDDTYLFGAGLQLDSIDAMEIVVGIEAKFSVSIPEFDMSALRTINTLADFVQSSRAAA